ncbi:hypothetical protein EWB00_005888 [Schistosoma japonicum]|uniref:Uncharacterized protein n=1 Tax=Schistosoma japonicum TaxID=6182 RepID=A0A4Z2D0E9_SCHJA|nr:hypothetical protein EWB00_005888 [Schistosoma japonicum]
MKLLFSTTTTTTTRKMLSRLMLICLFVILTTVSFNTVEGQRDPPKVTTTTTTHKEQHHQPIDYDALLSKFLRVLTEKVPQIPQIKNLPKEKVHKFITSLKKLIDEVHSLSLKTIDGKKP